MKRMKSFAQIIKFFLVALILCILLFPGTFGASHPLTAKDSSDQKIVSKIHQELEIPAGSGYYIKFDSQNLSLKSQDAPPYSDGLSESVVAAIAKSPRWIQQALTRQFRTLSDPEAYADLLLKSQKQYTDELAFSIVCCPTGKVPSPDILKENVESLYEHDQWIQYADIIDFDDGTGNYYSTTRYAVLVNGTPQQFLLPPEIYYWYLVHPKITGEDVDPVYESLWRNYLFEHNDLGYPLLKEKLSSIKYLWDCTSYSQPGDRLWDTCITLHPTAIEAVSYWIGKTVPYPAVGDRPSQANVIAHEHNGWCGELQMIAVAAQRAALIPSVGASNVGEDHVWREFYERGWHENDNWWSDTGGMVDNPDIYAYGWGKNLSAVYQYRCDDTISDDTARYIHPGDRITVSFNVKDSFLQPVDGARVAVLVKGPKDISWYKNYVWEMLQGMWDKLPPLLKGRLLTTLFEKFKGRFNAIPTEINGVTITIWNYTDLDGQCSFQLGKNHEYLFLIQEGNLRKPWQLARHNLIRNLKTHEDKEFRIILPDIAHRAQRTMKKELPSGDCQFTLSFSSSAYQPQRNFFTGGIGAQDIPGMIECFFVDTPNFEKYQAGKTFTCFQYHRAEQAVLTVSTQQQDWYVLFRNRGRATSVLLNVSAQVAVSTETARVQIVPPKTSILSAPAFMVADTVPFSGIATGEVLLIIGNDTDTILPMQGEWSYLWNTSGEEPGLIQVMAMSEGASDSMIIHLRDSVPPSIEITVPVSGVIVEREEMMISGMSSDNVGIDHVEVRVDNATWRTANGTTTWAISWDLSPLPLGDHFLSARAVDTQGWESQQTIFFALNETGHSWGPQFIEVFHLPYSLTNTSNVIVFANVTTTSPFSLKQLVLYCMNSTTTITREMYRYADHPIQARHEEDPKRNESNAPLFGVELGQFSPGETIMYWIGAIDTARNTKQSDVFSFTIT